MQNPAKELEWGDLRAEKHKEETEAAKQWKEYLEKRKKDLKKVFKQKLEKRTAKIIERILDLLPKNEGFTILIDDVSVRKKGYFHLRISGEHAILKPVGEGETKEATPPPPVQLFAADLTFS